MSTGTELPEDARRAALERALRWLTARARSEKEIADRLERLGFATDVVADTLATLRRLRYVDDQAFAAEFVRTYRARKGLSLRRLHYELQRHAISEAIIEAALGQADEAESDVEVVQRLLQRQATAADDPRALRRLVASLQRKGFGFETIRRALKHEGLWRD